MRIAPALAALASVLLTPALAPAIDISGQSRTYLQSRETVDSQRLLPIYEYLDLKANNVAGQNVSFHFGGWLRYDLGDQTLGKDSNSDLQYAYLSIRKDRGNGVLNLGRIPVYEGVLSERIDGAYARTDFEGGFGAAAFGGKPVETDFDNRSGDSVYGGRVSHGYAGVYRIGFAYLKEKNNSADFREEQGLDLWLRAARTVELSGVSSYNKITSGWMQHNYVLTIGSLDNLRVSAEFNQVSYRDYFQAATTTAFRLDPTIIDPNETMTNVGASLLYDGGGGPTYSLDYKKYSYDIAGSADYYGGRIQFGSVAKGGAGLALHRMDGAASALKYDEYRAYAFKKYAKIDGTLDVLYVAYDEPVSGVSNAYAAVAAAGYAIAPRTRLAADVEYAKNPFFDKEVKGLIKLVYGFGK